MLVRAFSRWHVAAVVMAPPERMKRLPLLLRRRVEWGRLRRAPPVPSPLPLPLRVRAVLVRSATSSWRTGRRREGSRDETRGVESSRG